MSSSIILPYPPKELNPNARLHWAKLSRAKKAYKSDCMWLLKGTEPLTEFSITFHPPNNHRRDMDNAIAAFKAGQDALSAVWGIDDSDFKPHYAPEFGYVVKGGRVLVEAI